MLLLDIQKMYAGSQQEHGGADVHMYGILSRGFAITAIAASLLTAATAAEFTIVNASRVSLRHLYISPCGARQWGTDQFAQPLPPSRHFTVSEIAPGCYDVEFVTDPWNVCVLAGATLHRREVWKVTEWTVFGSQNGDCSHVAAYVSAGRRAFIW
jgi:hypothetical protein